MTPPNVIVVHCHDLGTHLGCYHEGIDTPNIDRLAAEGATFENHFVTAPQCSPSRASLWTGLHPHQHGLMGLAHGAWQLDIDVECLPAILAAAEYDTHLFGLQHVTDDPRSIGFDHVHSEGNLTPAASPEIHEVNRAEAVADTVDLWLEKGAFEEPFFASIGVFELHRIEVDGKFGFNDGRYDDVDPSSVVCPSFLPDRPEVRRDLAELEGMLRSLDAGIGRILTGLDDAAIADDTLVVFTTEHGLAFPRAKGSCYDAGIRGALLMRFPDRIEAGQRFDQLISNVDILPTILDFVDCSAPSSINGRSFEPLLADRQYLPRERIFAGMTWHDRYNPTRAIRTNRYKYIRNFWHLPSVMLTNDLFASPSGRAVREEYYTGHRPYAQLFDLQQDPTEAIDLTGETDYAAVEATLCEELVEWMRRTDDPLLDGPIPPADYDDILPW